MNLSERRQKAWHEIGHSALAFVEGIPVLSIRIEQVGQAAGFCAIDDDWLRERLIGPDSATWAMKFIRFLLAGQVAETCWLQSDNRELTGRELDSWALDNRYIEVCVRDCLGLAKDTVEANSMRNEAMKDVEVRISSHEIQRYIKRLVGILAGPPITTNEIGGSVAKSIWLEECPSFS